MPEPRNLAHLPFGGTIALSTLLIMCTDLYIILFVGQKGRCSILINYAAKIYFLSMKMCSAHSNSSWVCRVTEKSRMVIVSDVSKKTNKKIYI